MGASGDKWTGIFIQMKLVLKEWKGFHNYCKSIKLNLKFGGKRCYVLVSSSTVLGTVTGKWHEYFLLFLFSSSPYDIATNDVKPTRAVHLLARNMNVLL